MYVYDCSDCGPLYRPDFIQFEIDESLFKTIIIWIDKMFTLRYSIGITFSQKEKF